MTEDLILYTHPMSRGRMIRWLLEEIGAPYRTEILEYGGSMKAPEYLSINPMGKVPALRHGDAVVTETAAICAYLADAFPAAKLAPPPSARADYYRWLFFTAGPLEAAVTNRTLGVQVPDEKRGFVGYGSYEAVLDALEKAVAGKTYIAGGQFSAADVFVGGHLNYGMMFGSIEKRPAFEAYWSGLSTRPAFKRAMDIDNDLMAAREKG